MMLWFFLKSGWCRLSLLYFISLSHSLFLVHNLVFVYAVAKVLLALLLHPLLSFRCRGLIQIRPVVSVRLLLIRGAGELVGAISPRRGWMWKL